MPCWAVFASSASVCVGSGGNPCGSQWAWSCPHAVSFVVQCSLGSSAPSNTRQAAGKPGCVWLRMLLQASVSESTLLNDA